MDRMFGLGVVVCLFNPDFSRIFLLKRIADKQAAGVWGSVGGRVELGEYLIDACVREAKEEIGVDLDPDSVVLADVKESPHLTEKWHAVHFVYASVLDEPVVLNEESEEYGWFDIESLPDNTVDSKQYLSRIRVLALEKLRKS